MNIGLDVLGARSAASRFSLNIADERRLAWSPDGSHLAIACLHGPLRVWKVGEDSAQALIDPTEPAHSLLSSHDSEHLLIGEADNGKLHVWRRRDGHVRHYQHAKTPVHVLAFSKDGRTLIAGHGRDGMLHLWDVLENVP